MDHFTFIGELDLSQKQERNLPFADTFPDTDRELLLGDDFDTYGSKTEIKLWNTLERTSIQNLPSLEDLKSQLVDFTFYVCLPLEKMINFVVKHELSTTDFTFCTGTPLNFSLNPRSATLFYAYSQSLARMDDLDNKTSDFWLVTFRLEVDHLMTLQSQKKVGTWNRLYIDHLFTAYDLALTDAEWSTCRCWTFGLKSGEFVDTLANEFLKNESPGLRRLNHLVLSKDFYDEHFGQDPTEEWSALPNEEDNFVKQAENFVAVSLIGTPPELPHANNLVQETLVREVFVSSKGIRFHFTEDCPGLQAAIAVFGDTLDEVKRLRKTLCSHCRFMTSFRTKTCCSLNCNYPTSWNPHFCCRKCFEGKGHGVHCGGPGETSVNTSGLPTANHTSGKGKSRSSKE
jgi:hypothetical protein